MKQTIEINVPEGFEVAEGEQPRQSIEGDYYWLTTWKEPFYCPTSGYAAGKHIILKKKAPEYERIEKRRLGEHDNKSWTVAYASESPFGEYVEIKALEDCLELLHVQENGWSLKHELKVKTLKELLK